MGAPKLQVSEVPAVILHLQTLIFSDTIPRISAAACNSSVLVPINPKGLAFVPPSGEGLASGAFVSDWYGGTTI